LNNNRGNNRRRGRGNNRQNGGGQQINRIDSRARGNAPQLLEKYRKLAHDSHLNGDRVTEEYYLQFADHYFRVIADTRMRQEEARDRRDDRWQDNGRPERDYSEDAIDYGDGYDEVRGEQRYDREDRGERSARPERQPRTEFRPEPEPQEGAEAERNEAPGDAPCDAVPDRNPYEPSENPFVRDGRSGRGLRQRRSRPERDSANAVNAAAPAPEADYGVDAFDPSRLPPAVPIQPEAEPVAQAVAPVEQAHEPVEAGPAEAKPRRRTRRPRQPVDDADETLQAVN
jgi:hypothetical protein